MIDITTLTTTELEFTRDDAREAGELGLAIRPTSTKAHEYADLALACDAEIQTRALALFTSFNGVAPTYAPDCVRVGNKGPI